MCVNTSAWFRIYRWIVRSGLSDEDLLHVEKGSGKDKGSSSFAKQSAAALPDEDDVTARTPRIASFNTRAATSATEMTLYGWNPVGVIGLLTLAIAGVRGVLPSRLPDAGRKIARNNTSLIKSPYCAQDMGCLKNSQLFSFFVTVKSMDMLFS